MSPSATARQQDLHHLSDAELSALLRDPALRPGAAVPPGPAINDVMGEVFARHHSAVLAYARTCCRDLPTAHDLAAEAFARTYRAVAAGHGPEHAWRPYLLTCVRHVATDWAHTGARTQLSDDFEKWAESLPAAQDVEDAVLAAEEGSLVLRAYRALPERWQAVLWHAVVEHEPAATTARRLGMTAGGIGSLVARAREGLREAYLREHLDQAVSDECRHYGGLLAASIRRPDKRATRDLGRHLQTCAGCARAERDLRDLNGRLGAILPAGILLWSPSTLWSSLGGHGAHLAAGKLGAAKLGVARFGAAKWAWTAAAVAGTAVTAVALLPNDVGLPDRAASVPVSASPAPTAPAAPVAPVAASTVPTAVVTPVAAPASSTPPSASPSASPSADAAGLPLVNVGSGLCIGVADSGAAGSLQLQQCSGKPPQRWQRLPASQDTYQLRNAATGTCIDGTTAGGNSIPVTLRDCRSDAGRAEQLWRFEPAAQPGAFRLWFVPPVPQSDYSQHLLGPHNWAKIDPPQVGSLVAHLPDYYDSVNLLFTMG
ncbi:sigma-70 family RNA polymerase sigma factor [Streptomyces kaniharaensis]|uniref:Sigma-70 family RNA polymerase sigma factor n=1 Tax=Streptomyces kaniharaensis TaxID=212423 RepID=A0A6N7KWV1_9ACTN|nr:sigma-70 family RNA polymerase sigma factor [Streptomyces kaniharaensis]MQS16146.1 sigma-70 family RNA polymerase sigma factor [Streptomyces kaniharaensis]